MTMVLKPAVATTTLILMVVAGFGMAASGITARGTDLRGERAKDLRQLVLNRASAVEETERSVNTLRTNVDELAYAYYNDELRDIRRQLQKLKPLAGLETQAGSGLVITLDDAPHKSGDVLPDGIDPNWLLIHQADVQGVINALWAGGATAVSVMDERIINSSAIKCVGSTLLVNGQVYSPPFIIAAIGNSQEMNKSLFSDENVAFFSDLAQAYGLTFKVESATTIEIKAYDGLIGAQYGEPLN